GGLGGEQGTKLHRVRLSWHFLRFRLSFSFALLPGSRRLSKRTKTGSNYMAIGFTDAKPQPHLVGQCWKPSHYRLWQQVKISEKLQQPYSPLKIAPNPLVGWSFLELFAAANNR